MEIISLQRTNTVTTANCRADAVVIQPCFGKLVEELKPECADVIDHGAEPTRPVIVERTCTAVRVRFMNSDITDQSGFITALTKELLGEGVA
jgi:hypothetical protein